MSELNHLTLLWSILTLCVLHLAFTAGFVLHARRLRGRIAHLERTIRSLRLLAQQFGDADLNHHVDDLLAAVACTTTETA